MPSLPRTRHALILAAGILALAVAPAAAQATTPAQITLGVNIDNAPDQLAPMQSYTQIAGRKPAIVMWYQQWSEPLYYSDQLANAKAIGAVPMITWDPIANGVGIPLQDIVSGKWDAYIQASAKAAAAWGSLVYIRLGHEMNLAGSPFGPGAKPGNTAAEYVAAWRHVVTIFRQAHATNVEWVWSPNVYCGGGCPFTAFYPGDAWVDWVALDGYNYSSVDGDPWMTFSQIFGPSYKILAALTSKPMMIGETASAEQGGSKATWITQAFLQQVPSLYPRIRAVVWFDRNKETDWRINSSTSSLAAWQQVVAAPLYGGTLSTLLSIDPLASDVNSVGTGTTGAQTSTSGGSTGTTAPITGTTAPIATPRTSGPTGGRWSIVTRVWH